MSSPEPLHSRHLMDFQARIHPELALHRKPAGARLSVCYFTGGQISGERLHGQVLPGGGDWAEYLTLDHIRIDVRGMLLLDDQSLVYMKYQGVWKASPGALSATIDGSRTFLRSEHYLRVTASFETDSLQYDWLNSVVAIGVGRWEDNAVKYCFHEIL